MKSPQVHTPGKYVHRESFHKSQDDMLPFHPLRWGYSNDRTINFDTDHSAFVIFYVLEGIAFYNKLQESAYVSEDRLIVSGCNAKMSFSRATPQWKFFYVAISGTHAKFYYDTIRSCKSVIPAGPAANSLAICFTDLCSLPRPESVYDNMQVCYLIHQILHELIQVTREPDGGSALSFGSAHVVDQARKYIEEHYRETLTIDFICQQMNFSKFYLCRLFKEQTGQTLHRYLTDYRINKSKEYLTRSRLTIHAIAREVGFKNTLAYSRAFKQYVNMTPSEYREAF